MDQRAANMRVRRDRIIASAETLIMRESLSRFTMRDLAEEVGLSVKTLYNLCGDKEAIAAEVEDRAYASLEAELQSLPEHVDPVAQVLAILAAGADKAIARKGILHPLLRGEDPEMPIRKPRAFGLIQSGAVLAERALRLAVQKDLLMAELDPHVVANQLSINWFGTAMLWARNMLNDEAFRVRVRYSGLCNLLPYATAQYSAELRQEIIALQTQLPPFETFTVC